LIFMGRAMMVAPVGGSALRSARFSRPHGEPGTA
jgi:hypothetical protein